MPHERIQKTLAAAGFGSRRHCEQLVLDGRVAVNGRTLSDLPALVDPAADRITVDGRPVRAEPLVYFMLNKPPGVLCTNDDPAGRTRACDLLRGVRERVFPVGRLDVDSMGLLLLTNDGPLAQTLTHPRYGVPKTYRAEIAGAPSDGDLARLRSGVWLSEGKTAPAQIAVIHRQKNKSILEITLRESRNREVRRMLAKLGHNVRRLVRIRVGKLSIRKLGLGAFRKLTPDEIKYLRGLADHVPAHAAPGIAPPRQCRRPRPRPDAPYEAAHGRSADARTQNPRGARTTPPPPRERRILPRKQRILPRKRRILPPS